MKKRKAKKISPYIYILPTFMILLLVIVVPIIYVVTQSFYTTVADENIFVGLRNYQLAVKDELLWIAMKNNLKLFLCVPVLTVISLAIASVLYNKIRGWRFYRSVIFIPYILAIPVVGIVFSYLLQYNGVFNSILRGAGLEGLALDWLGNPDLAFPSVAVVIIWKQIGFGVVLFLARMMSIDRALYESADVDGASWLQKFCHITIPQTKSIIEFYIIITLIEMLSWVFNFIYVMTAGGPGNKTLVLEYLIYKKSFGGGDFNIAMAISVILLILASILIAIHQVVMRKED
ncbi:sugar ABC transporter permease [Faecalicatena orotica]|uniref:Carbohydrate ABC transporter membrane protein 1 (CUT1 family) n=1 Tax=Faecalicatena orotica TaxID=1544 RepID=A0A2Y9CAI3_9FIRM|nr:sugar ABC transporter permease [Faecalicatena orotica]PWJ23642.1 carbohydrate ABC transporter membrane protein 1 (CUT1 family) [Faecalicatena orotica]SSA57554.1 carbohydrate ABC transporter membrane protein 1, CUT1 family [Faecalicatena orotica]